MSIEQRLNRLEKSLGEPDRKVVFSWEGQDDERLIREHEASGDPRELIIYKVSWKNFVQASDAITNHGRFSSGPTLGQERD